MNSLDTQELDDVIGKVIDSQKLFEKAQKRFDKLVKQIDFAFHLIFQEIRDPTPAPKKVQTYNLFIFRKCTAVVATCPRNEYNVLFALQEIFVKCYTAPAWSPSLLDKLLTYYNTQWTRCYYFTVQEQGTISNMLMLIAPAVQADAITRLLSVLNKFTHKEAMDAEQGLKNQASELKHRTSKIMDETPA